MAKGGPVWTRDRLEQLYGALDEAVQTASGSTLCSDAVDLIVAATGLTKLQVANKLRALGRQLRPRLSKDEFIESWAEIAAQFKGSGSNSDASQRSPTPPSRISSRATQRSKHASAGNRSQSPKSTTPHQPDPDHVENQEPVPDEGLDNGNHGAQDNPSSKESNNPVVEQPGDNREDDEQEAEQQHEMFYFQPEEMDMIKEWRVRMASRRFRSPPLNIDLKITLSEIWGTVEHAVESFRKAQPIAFLTTAKMTRATLDLARTFMAVSGRSQVEERLRTLFGDPAFDVPLALRAFAAVAITKWVFEGFPAYQAPRASSQLGASLEAFAKYIPRAANDTKEALEISYFEKVVEPTFPLLAREYQTELFDIFLSLRATPEPHFDSPENQDPEATQGFDFRQQHQSEWVTHMEKAFLDALELRSTLAKSSSVFNFRLCRQGVPFNEKSMSPVVATRARAKVTPQHRVLQCMSPEITSYRRGYSGHVKDRFLVAHAKVIIEGFEAQCSSLLEVDRTDDERF